MIDPNELLFSVDENNNSIKPQSRSYSHANRIWHRCTHIYIIKDNESKILCQKRSLLKDSNPGLWEPFFGGHLRPGQTYEDGAIMELGEELGLVIKKGQLKFVKEVKNDNHPEYIGVFTYSWSGDPSELNPEKDEVDEISFCSLEDIIKNVTDRSNEQWTYFGYGLEFLHRA
jgi:isopentenyldiphosphate isomerase